MYPVRHHIFAKRPVHVVACMHQWLSSPRKIFDALALRGFQKNFIQSDQVGMEIPTVIGKSVHMSRPERIFSGLLGIGLFNLHARWFGNCDHVLLFFNPEYVVFLDAFKISNLQAAARQQECDRVLSVCLWFSALCFSSNIIRSAPFVTFDKCRMCRSWDFCVYNIYKSS